jgi:hypothetical protein
VSLQPNAGTFDSAASPSAWLGLKRAAENFVNGMPSPPGMRPSQADAPKADASVGVAMPK